MAEPGFESYLLTLCIDDAYFMTIELDLSITAAARCAPCMTLPRITGQRLRQIPGRAVLGAVDTGRSPVRRRARGLPPVPALLAALQPFGSRSAVALLPPTAGSNRLGNFPQPCCQSCVPVPSAVGACRGLPGTCMRARFA